MDNMNSPVAITGESVMVLPSFGKSPELRMDMAKIREAEHRIPDARTVNPITYVGLEHVINEAYRDLKRHLSAIGYQITLADKALEQAKADVILDGYPQFMEGRPKSQDNADMRKSFLMRDPDYLAALDRLNQLKALESNFDGKIRVMERVSSYMKKEMDLLIRSGMASKDLYVSSGRK